MVGLILFLVVLVVCGARVRRRCRQPRGIHGRPAAGVADRSQLARSLRQLPSVPARGAQAAGLGRISCTRLPHLGERAPVDLGTIDPDGAGDRTIARSAISRLFEPCAGQRVHPSCRPGGRLAGSPSSPAASGSSQNHASLANIASRRRCASMIPSQVSLRRPVRSVPSHRSANATGVSAPTTTST